MKIYLVMSYDAQEGDRLLHVASTEEKAQSWLERLHIIKGRRGLLKLENTMWIKKKL